MSFFRWCVVDIPNIPYIHITSDPQNVKNVFKIYKIVLNAATNYDELFKVFL